MKQIIIKNKYGNHLLQLDDNDLNIIKDKNIRIMCELDGRPTTVLVANIGDKNGHILSRIMLSPPSNMVVDHINRNPLDNRRSNLRICTQRENSRNKTKQSNNSSGIPSVEKHNKLNLWRVRVKYLGQKIHFGYFKTLEEAGYVRDQVIMQLHGEFAKTYIIK